MFLQQAKKLVYFTITKRKEKFFFANLNEKDIRDNKKFWQTIKPFLQRKLN